MAGPYRNFTPGPTATPRPGGGQGTMPQDLLNPTVARAYVKPQSYLSAYAPSPVGSGGNGTIPGLNSYDNIGKTQVQLVGAPSAAQPGQESNLPEGGIYAPPAAVPQTGVFEGLLRGIVDQFGGGLPADIRAHLSNGLGLVANLLDIPAEVIGNLPQIPLPQTQGPLAAQGNFMPNQQQFFGELPETAAKKEAEAAMAKDPANALYYMSQYMRYHEVEIAHGLGVSPLVADYFVPSNNLGDQIMRTLGLLGLPGRLTSRTYAESSMRNAEGTILNVDPKTLNPELQRIRGEYEAGNLTRTEFFDEVTKNGFSFSNSIWDNMMWEMVTDPLLVASFGTGLGLKVAATSGRLAMIGRTVQAAIETLTPTERAAMDSYAIGKVFDKFTQRAMSIGPPDAMRLVRDTDRFEYLAKAHPQFEQQELAKMSSRGRAMVALDPLIQGAASVSRTLNAPWDLFGHITNRGFKNGERIAEFSSIASVEGVFQAYGPQRILAIQKLFDGMGIPDELKKIYGRMGANAELGVNKDSMNRMVMAKGSTPPHMPDAILRAQSGVYHSRLALQVEGWMRRVMTQYLPTTRFGKEAIEETMARQRKISELKLMEMAGQNADAAAIKSLVDHADNETLALIEHMYYAGPILKTFIDARNMMRSAMGDTALALRKKMTTGGAGGGPMVGHMTRPRIEAKLATAERRAKLFERVTVVGPNTLTFQAAKKLLAKVNKKDVTAVREGVEQYEQLFSNFAAKGLDDDTLLRNMHTYLQELTAGGRENGRLVNELGKDELPREMRDWYDKQADFKRRSGDKEQYRVGMAPAENERWRAVYNKEDELVGINTWADAVPDVANTPRVSSFSVIRDRLFRPIRGERQLEEARRDFRVRAVNDYGLSRSEANSLFGAIRRKASQANTMPRGLTSSELNDLITEMNWTDEQVQRVGQRGMARLVASAFEGRAFTVGITQKITGRAKLMGTRLPGNNWLSVVAERLYPMARFAYNPIFLAQEAAEPFFWNLLRGVKPGMFWRREDLKSFEALRRSGFLGEWADQWEYSPSALMLFAQGEARRVAGADTAIGQFSQRVLGEGRKVGSLAELKRLNYVRQNSRDFGFAFKKYIEDTDPQFWDVLVRESGTNDPARVGNYYWLNKALYNPDHVDTQAFLMDATLPANLGASPHQMPQALATFHKFVNFDAMRKSIREGGYDEVKFRAAMNTLKATPEYIDNAWAMASHIGPAKWWEKSGDAYALAKGNTRAAKNEARNVMRASRAIVQQRARILGYSEEEYLARQMTRPMEFLDTNSKVPLGSHYQMMESENTMRFYGHEMLEPSSPEIKRVSREARAVAGTPMGGEAEMQRLIEDATAGGPVAAAPTGETTRLTANAIDGSSDGVGRDLIHIAGPGLDYESLVEMAHNVLGADNIERIVLGNRRMPSMFHMMTQMLPDDSVWRFLEQHMAFPDNLHMNRLRVEALRGRSILDAQADLLASPDAQAVGETLADLAPNSGTDYFNMNRIEMRLVKKSVEKGPPNTGIHLIGKPEGADNVRPHYYGWYDENGDLVSTAIVTAENQNLNRVVTVPTTPGGPVTGISERRAELEGVGGAAYTPAEEKRFLEAQAKVAIAKSKGVAPDPVSQLIVQRRIGLLPQATTQEVAAVGTKIGAHSKGYYGKLADYVDSLGLHKWNDITGRGSYDLPGSAAAQSLLRKQDKASLVQARELLASRMLAGFSHYAHQADFDPQAILRTMQSVIEAGSGKHARNVPMAHLAVEQMLDFGRASGDEIIPNWKQRAHLESMLPAEVRGVDTINPSMEGALAHGYREAPAVGPSLMEVMDAEARGERRPLPTTRPDVVTPAQFSKMQQDYREFAARANADALLGRTDWTAADVQALNIARYRQAMGKGIGNDADKLMNSQYATINFELEPHPGTDLSEAFPSTEWVNNTKPSQLPDWNKGLAMAHGDIGKWWAQNIGEVSGVSVVHVSTGPSKHIVMYDKGRLAGMTAEQTDYFAKEARSMISTDEYNTLVKNDEWDEHVSDFITDHSADNTGEWQALGPSVSIVVTGSPESIEAAVVATGGAFQRREVVASYIEHVAKPGHAIKNNWDQSWVSDFVIPQDAAGLHEPAIINQIDKLWPNQDLVRQSIVMPNGDRAIRVHHEVGLVTEDGLRKLLADPESDSIVNELASQGVTMNRGVVDKFSMKVDIDRNRDDITNLFEARGEFVDQEGRTIRKADVDAAEWDARLNWRISKLNDPWLQAADAYPHVATALRNRLRGEALSQTNIAFHKYLWDFTDEWRGRDVNLPVPLRGWHNQVAPKGGIRAATKTDNNLNASIFLMKKVNPTSIPHELMHQMVPHMDDSMIEAIVSAYSDATGWRKRVSRTQSRKPYLNDTQEEWLAEEFVKYATTGKVVNSRLQSAFNMMGKLVKEDAHIRNLPEAHPRAKSLFDQLLGQENVGLTAVPFDPEQYRHLAAARYLMSATEDQAHKTHYFARGRNFLERSVNHPYLGYYPASYMWGKVVPELIRFLAKEPFGIKAPMGGYMLASHVSQAISLELNTNPDSRKWVADHPALIRFVQMMLPGTPWDIPVNTPAWMRHLAKVQGQNAIRTAAGHPEEKKGFDLLGEAGNTINYAFGLGRSFTTVGGIIKEANKTPDPQAAQFDTRAYLQAFGLTPPDPDVQAASDILNSR